MQFERKIEGEDSEFSASDGWLDRWKKRFGIRQIAVSGEALSSDKGAVPLNYKMLPSKTLPSKQEGAVPGYKKARNESLCWHAVMQPLITKLG